MIDPNIKKKRQFAIYLTILIIVLPFVFLYLKYADKEPESLARNLTVTRPQPQIKQQAPVKQENETVPQISQDADKISGNDVTIYKQDLINNSVKIPFEVRDMIVSRDKKRLYTLGHDRDGISVIDISNLDHIKLLGLFYFPEAKYFVENIQAAESNDGKSLYVASPNLGILRFDVTDPKNIKIAAQFDAKGYSKIKLSQNGKLAYVKATNGMVILDISSDNMNKIGEFINSRGEGDIAIYSDKYVFMSDFSGLHTLDVSDAKNIKEVYKQEDFKNAINLQISPDKKYLYANELQNFRVYGINDISDIEHLKDYIVSNRAYTFDIGSDGKIAYISRSKDGAKDTASPSIDVVDISGKFRSERLKSYYTPEIDTVNAALPLDKHRMIVSLMANFKCFKSVINNDADELMKEAEKNKAKNKDFESLSKNTKNLKPIWHLPFPQNGFASVSMAVPTEDGYILAGEHEQARTPDLFMKIGKDGREIWRKVVDKNYQGTARLIAAQMQSYYVIGNEKTTYVIDKATNEISNKLPYPLKHVAPTDNDEFIACDYANNVFRMDKNAKIIWTKQIDVSHLDDEFYIKYEYDPKDPTKEPIQREIKKPKEGLEKLIKTKDGNFILFIKELGFLKFSPSGKTIFETKIETDGYFEGMLEGKDGSISAIFKSKNKYDMGTIKLIRLGKNGEFIKKSTVYNRVGDFLVSAFTAYKDGYLIGINPYDKENIPILEISGDGRILDEAYLTDTGNETRLYEILNVADQGALLLGSRTNTKPDYERYVKGKAMKFSGDRIQEAFMIMINLTQKISEQNLDLKDRK